MFSDELSTLCAKHLARAVRDEDANAIAEMIERLVSSLGMTVAVAGRGHPALIQELMTGVENHLYEAATAHVGAAKALRT